MKLRKILLLVLISFIFFTSATIGNAAEFAWMPDFNVQAQADPSGFRVRLASRFHIGDAQITGVLSNYPSPADAYVALRLGEMSGKSIDDVTERYKKNKGQGWGVLAKNLGIKPGSSEFHALKRGNDIYDLHGNGKDKKDKSKKGKDKDKDKGKNKNK